MAEAVRGILPQLVQLVAWSVHLGGVQCEHVHHRGEQDEARTLSACMAEGDQYLCREADRD